MLKMNLHFKIFHKDVFFNYIDVNRKILQKIKMYF